MSPERFEHLLTCVGPLISKGSCRSRKPIPAAERLLVTLRYLATGDSQQSQSFYFRMGRSTVSNVLRETCDAIWLALNKEYLKTPTTTSDWIHISAEFEDEWNFPHCLGAIDGKHIMMECPKNGGSAYFNYKSFHSIVLLAICDAKYCFSFIDIGAYGSTNDASVLSNSAFGQAFENHPTDLNLPSPSSYKDRNLPYVVVGDDIFPLKPWLMKPYPGKNLSESERVYNYRLSRARRTIENTFGIFAAKWRIYRRPIRANLDLVDKVVKATVVLKREMMKPGKNRKKWSKNLLRRNWSCQTICKSRGHTVWGEKETMKRHDQMGQPTVHVPSLPNSSPGNSVRRFYHLLGKSVPKVFHFSLIYPKEHFKDAQTKSQH